MRICQQDEERKHTSKRGGFVRVVGRKVLARLKMSLVGWLACSWGLDTATHRLQGPYKQFRREQKIERTVVSVHLGRPVV